MIISFVTELLGLRAAKLFYFRMLRNLILAPMRWVPMRDVNRKPEIRILVLNPIWNRFSTIENRFAKKAVLTFLVLITPTVWIQTWASTGIFSEGENWQNILFGKFDIDGKGTNEGAENKNITAKSVNIKYFNMFHVFQVFC